MHKHSMTFTTFYLNSFQLENIDMGLAATHTTAKEMDRGHF